MFVYELSGCWFQSTCSHLNFRFQAASRKEFLDIQATTECGFTLKRVRDMIRIYKETIICFVKVQSENMKMAWGIKLFIPAQQLEEQSSKQGKVIFQM